MFCPASLRDTPAEAPPPNSISEAFQQQVMLQAYISEHCAQLQKDNDMLRAACTVGGVSLPRVPGSGIFWPKTPLSQPLKPLTRKDDAHLAPEPLEDTPCAAVSAVQQLSPAVPKLKWDLPCAPEIHQSLSNGCSADICKASSDQSGRQSFKSRFSLQSLSSSATHKSEAAGEKASQKAMIQKALSEQGIRDPYKKSGICQKMVRSSKFDKVSYVLVCCNMIWIAVDADYNHHDSIYDAPPVFRIGANLFCTAFLVELLVRFNAWARKLHFLFDKMNAIDSFCVICLVLETWLLPLVKLVSGGGSSTGSVGRASILRMVRLVRLARIATVTKLLNAMPELLIIIESMKAALRAVFLTLSLLTVLLFVFGITFRLLAVDSELSKGFFKSVPVSMYHLLVYGVLSLDEVGEIAVRLNEVSTLLAVLFFIFVLLVSCCVMNMLIGVMCEVVKEASRLLEENLVVEAVTIKLSKILSDLDTNGNMRISKDELFHILGNRTALLAFQEMGTDLFALVDWADTIFWDPVQLAEKELTIPEFMEVVLNLRVTKLATVKHILNLEKAIHRNTDIMMSALEELRPCE